jgi:hypothetical protein
MRTILPVQGDRQAGLLIANNWTAPNREFNERLDASICR